MISPQIWVLFPPSVSYMYRMYQTCISDFPSDTLHGLSRASLRDTPTIPTNTERYRTSSKAIRFLRNTLDTSLIHIRRYSIADTAYTLLIHSIGYAKYLAVFRGDMWHGGGRHLSDLYRVHGYVSSREHYVPDAIFAGDGVDM